jgi:anti-sigma regulatory factor (Ser/Thr protein kinase)
LADRPAWIVCPYDARVLPPSVVDDAMRTHAPADGFEAIVRELAPKHEQLPDLEPLPQAPDAQTFRDLLAARLTDAAVPGSMKLDMLVAANEVFANALNHGGGVLLVRTGVVGGRFVCEVTDAGPGLDDPFAGYLPPASQDGPGAGLWVARQLMWRVDLLSSPGGLSVRLWL